MIQWNTERMPCADDLLQGTIYTYMYMKLNNYCICDTWVYLTRMPCVDDLGQETFVRPEETSRRSGRKPG